MALARYVEEVVARLKKTPVDLELLPEAASRGSLLAGGAGVAFFLHEVARLREDSSALTLARRWCDATLECTAHSRAEDWRGMRAGFLIGESGVRYVEALVAARSGDGERSLAAVTWIAENAPHLASSRQCELVGGAAGLVCLARDLEARLPANPDYAPSRALLEQIRSRGTESVLAQYAEPIALGSRDYFGVAHGVAGELWALVVALGAGHPTVRARLAELAAFGETDDEGLLYWRLLPGSDATEFLGTWCNGMPGHALVWCEVARQTRSAESMTLAQSCAESVTLLENGAPSICCGHAGQALALQRHAELTSDPKAARRAYARIVSATKMAEDDFLPLWQGSLGVALVAMGRLHGERTLPLLEPLAHGHAPFTASSTPSSSG